MRRPLALGAWRLAMPAGVLLLDGCAGSAQTRPADDRLVDVASGAALDREAVLARVRQADHVLLGELHDNPHHHARRGDLLAEMGRRLGPLRVVAEHLPAGASPALTPSLDAAGLQAALAAAGFDARGWRWPLHEPLFTAIARAGHRLHGGNLPRDEARRTAREGLVALPAGLQALLASAPLPEAARARLDQALLDGHCGHLPASRLPGMVAAQRGRDAAMAQALLAQRGAQGRAPGPAVLLAGNGHVRRDHGVPLLLARAQPHARVLAIGFLEPGDLAAGTPWPYDIAWITPAAVREDPCKGFGARPAAR